MDDEKKNDFLVSCRMTPRKQGGELKPEMVNSSSYIYVYSHSLIKREAE
jgi:hypothetical protein